MVTVPGPEGVGVAFLAELVITFILMLVILSVSNRPNMARYTGLCAGVLLALYILVESPLSGTSMNPARTLASGVPAGIFTAMWVYFTAPPLGMLLAAQVYRAIQGRHAVHCAKLHHQNNRRCIFCGFGTKSPTRPADERPG